jgi:zinc transport system substrate-binding protein
MKMVFMMKLIRGGGALLATASLVLVAGCGTGPAGGSSSTSSDQLDVVVAFYPFQFIAERVAGDRARVTSLTQPGAEPHDLELTPRQVGGLSSADLVIYEKTFQPAVDQAVAQSGNPKVLDTSTVVPLQPAASEPEHAGEAEPEAGQEQGHDHGPEIGEDPHVWLDPANMATITAEVERRLSSADPDHAATYAANAKSLEDELTGLGTDFKRGLTSCQRSEFITTHAAFGYLARRYGLEQIGITGLSPDAEPSPARIAAVQTEAKAHGVTTIFYETLVSPAVATSIASDLGLQVDVLDPIEGITDQSRGRDYLEVMRSNLVALRKANGCP